MFQKVSEQMNQVQATLSNHGAYTIFSVGNRIIRFRSPYSLEKYTEVKQWDNGYIVVMAKYKHNTNTEEEYIDLIPILENLYIDAKTFLAPVKKVRISYD